MAFFMLEAGTSTVLCLAEFALRIRVSISAMGSVMCIMDLLKDKVTGSFRLSKRQSIRGTLTESGQVFP